LLTTFSYDLYAGYAGYSGYARLVGDFLYLLIALSYDVYVGYLNDFPLLGCSTSAYGS
jgi:hypothetical protein